MWTRRFRHDWVAKFVNYQLITVIVSLCNYLHGINRFRNSLLQSWKLNRAVNYPFPVISSGEFSLEIFRRDVPFRSSNPDFISDQTLSFSVPDSGYGLSNPADHLSKLKFLFISWGVKSHFFTFEDNETKRDQYAFPSSRFPYKPFSILDLTAKLYPVQTEMKFNGKIYCRILDLNRWETKPMRSANIHTDNSREYHMWLIARL